MPYDAKRPFRLTSGYPRVVSLGYLGNTNQNQKSTLTHLLILSSYFQNGLKRPISTNNHRNAFLVNGLFGGQVEAVEPQGEVL